MLGSSLSLVKTLESTVVSLIESPVFRYWDVVATKLSGHVVVGHYSTSEHRCESKIELIAILLEKLASELSLLDSVLSKCYICPARESVLLVPCGLTMSEENDLVNFLSNVLLHL